MKIIAYLLFFSVISVVLSACGGDKKMDDSKVEHATETVVPTASVVDNKLDAAQALDPALNAKLKTGEKLVKTHCSSCHKADIYTRTESTIKSADALLARVKACDANIGTALFDEDMDAITTYLEVKFYKFSK